MWVDQMFLKLNSTIENRKILFSILQFINSLTADAFAMHRDSILILCCYLILITDVRSPGFQAAF